MATAQAMSVEDVASWAAGLFDDAVVRKLTEGYIDGEMLALYAKQEHHELLKRDLDLPPVRANAPRFLESCNVESPRG